MKAKFGQKFGQLKRISPLRVTEFDATKKLNGQILTQVWYTCKKALIEASINLNLDFEIAFNLRLYIESLRFKPLPIPVFSSTFLAPRSLDSKIGTKFCLFQSKMDEGDADQVASICARSWK